MMGKEQSKPSREVHVIHHYVDGKQSDAESNQELYSSILNISRSRSKSGSQYSLSIDDPTGSGYSLYSPNSSTKSTAKKKKRLSRFSSLSAFSKGSLWRSKSTSLWHEQVEDRNYISDSGFRNDGGGLKNYSDYQTEMGGFRNETSGFTTNEYHSVLGSSEESGIGSRANSSDNNSFTDDLYCRYKPQKEPSNFLPSTCDEDDEETWSLSSEPYRIVYSNHCIQDNSDSETDYSDNEEKSLHPHVSNGQLKPGEFLDYFEKDHHGCVVFDNVWSNLMWREALRPVSEEEITMATMPSSSRVTMHGPPKIPKTPSKAINNMLESRCGKPFDSKAKAMVATVICGVFTVITMIYDKLHKDTIRPSHKMWMVSCGVVGLAAILASYLVYAIIIGSAFLLHSLLYYGTIMVALAGVGLCVSGMVFFDKEAVKEDFAKE